MGLVGLILTLYCAGAFLTGLIVPREGGLAIALTEKLEDMVSIIFLPLVSNTLTRMIISHHLISYFYFAVLHAIRPLDQLRFTQ